MFDVFLYPVSAVLWLWHTAFGALFGPGTGLAWVLSVVFLVFTVRALLVLPALSQLRAAHRMRVLAPRLQELRETHRHDRARLTREIQRLHTENGTSPFTGCLPALIQIPAFLSLYWVLRDFTPGATGNHVFDQAGVRSFLGADVFGARLGAWLSQQPAELAALGTDRPHLIAVALPLMLLAGLATFLSVRLGLRRQSTAVPQPAGVSKVLAWLAPLGVLVSGWFFPVPLGLLLYFFVTNVWTLVQQHVLTARVDREADHRPGAAGTP